MQTHNLPLSSPMPPSPPQPTPLLVPPIVSVSFLTLTLVAHSGSTQSPAMSRKAIRLSGSAVSPTGLVLVSPMPLAQTSSPSNPRSSLVLMQRSGPRPAGSSSSETPSHPQEHSSITFVYRPQTQSLDHSNSRTVTSSNLELTTRVVPKTFINA